MIANPKNVLAYCTCIWQTRYQTLFVMNLVNSGEEKNKWQTRFQTLFVMNLVNPGQKKNSEILL